MASSKASVERSRMLQLKGVECKGMEMRGELFIKIREGFKRANI